MAFSRRLIARISLILGTLITPGCSVLLQPPKVPMPLAQHIDQAGRHNTLLVFLPGIEDGAGDFAREGFVAEVRRRGLPVDMVSVDAHFGYYMSRTLVKRLRADVIDPARRRGYDHIWLVGISLGGLGSLLYSREFPEDVQGVIALAPYLGDDPLIDEITQAGGPARWQPSPGTGDFRAQLWGYLRGYEEAPARMPRLILAYGAQDRYAAGHDLLAGLLPPTRVIKQPGGHYWETWQKLWRAALDRAEAELGPAARPAGEQQLAASAHPEGNR